MCDPPRLTAEKAPPPTGWWVPQSPTPRSSVSGARGPPATVCGAAAHPKTVMGVRNCDVWGSYMWILKGCVKTCNKICQKLGPNLKSLDRPYSQNEYILVRKCLGKENILDCFPRTCVRSEKWCGVWGSYMWILKGCVKTCNKICQN